jgi:hypothetical protein
MTTQKAVQNTLSGLFLLIYVRLLKRYFSRKGFVIDISYFFIPIAMIFKVLSVLIISGLPLACNNDDPAAAKSRDIKFEVTGNFSGTISATYINSSGGGTIETITSIPWIKSILYAATVPSTAMSIGAAGGKAGQTIRLKIFAGGKLISDTPGTADNTGRVVITSPAYIF